MVGNALGPLGPGGVETGEFYSWCCYNRTKESNSSIDAAIRLMMPVIGPNRLLFL